MHMPMYVLYIGNKNDLILDAVLSLLYSKWQGIRHNGLWEKILKLGGIGVHRYDSGLL